ncbi:MAG: aspartyl/asparaginyl beta-hydroxylase domain-containing protein [Ginsengibacter sp.]
MANRIFLKTREGIKRHIFRPLLLGVGKGIAPFSTVGNPPVFPNSTFPWTSLLEENWPAIRKELSKILLYNDELPNLQDLQHEQSSITTDNKWKTFFLYGFGEKAKQNCAKCPETTAVLEHIPGLLTAFFSILHPGKHIPAHKGLFKGIIRSHLALIVPGKNGECRMKLDNQVLHWKEGKAFVFDDTYRHEVWNDSDGIRVVLLIDTIRPFNKPFSQINKGVIKLITESSHVKEAADNHREWEAKFNKLFS